MRMRIATELESWPEDNHMTDRLNYAVCLHMLIQHNQEIGPYRHKSPPTRAWTLIRAAPRCAPWKGGGWARAKKVSVTSGEGGCRHRVNYEEQYQQERYFRWKQKSHIHPYIFIAHNLKCDLLWICLPTPITIAYMFIDRAKEREMYVGMDVWFLFWAEASRFS